MRSVRCRGCRFENWPGDRAESSRAARDARAAAASATGGDRPPRRVRHPASPAPDAGSPPARGARGDCAGAESQPTRRPPRALTRRPRRAIAPRKGRPPRGPARWPTSHPAQPRYTARHRAAGCASHRPAGAAGASPLGRGQTGVLQHQKVASTPGEAAGRPAPPDAACVDRDSRRADRSNWRANRWSRGAGVAVGAMTTPAVKSDLARRGGTNAPVGLAPSRRTIAVVRPAVPGVGRLSPGIDSRSRVPDWQATASAWATLDQHHDPWCRRRAELRTADR